MQVKDLKEYLKNINDKGEVHLISSDKSGTVKATRIYTCKSEYTGAKNILITSW